MYLTKFLKPLFKGVILRRLRNGVNKIRSSSQRLEHYRDFGKAIQKASSTLEMENTDETNQNQTVVKELILDFKTRWNSTYAMIERAMETRRAYNMTCSSIAKLESYHLGEREWQVLQELHTLLTPFSEVTRILDGEQYPSLSSAVIGYNVLMDHLEDHHDNGGKEYQCMQLPHHWILAPKFQWWSDQEWEAEYIEQATRDVTGA
ncbi:hypothetical protein EC973_007245 [Apophysomyces ossiformis]|uniref:Uncharacterized protein n=1 Tax=Apophysomyces ossiformis TaxID=679940 RepID=A0A8H7BU78_9FUNG|nr:hypothetical protein EC973_007245 [Apophysomyces ossiformis]